ncbi:hypothetical protein HANVADRAFT_51708 [Hanseniaspora valbyensis NRRL Y-1626]|uniref:Uncharacterized protein n=1 Tax=Hanseniaspora valbyensis NRRL Y-1626 TaxID=766949 RepID=A0A1B7TI59_9ASCO|nr:hypothetical protein HANVADRAFT_51708 [Hanseniaspora valbyensis NRRL Y-1626]
MEKSTDKNEAKKYILDIMDSTLKGTYKDIEKTGYYQNVEKTLAFYCELFDNISICETIISEKTDIKFKMIWEFIKKEEFKSLKNLQTVISLQQENVLIRETIKTNTENMDAIIKVNKKLREELNDLKMIVKNLNGEMTPRNNYIQTNDIRNLSSNSSSMMHEIYNTNPNPERIIQSKPLTHLNVSEHNSISNDSADLRKNLPISNELSKRVLPVTKNNFFDTNWEPSSFESPNKQNPASKFLQSKKRFEERFDLSFCPSYIKKLVPLKQQRYEIFHFLNSKGTYRVPKALTDILDFKVRQFINEKKKEFALLNTEKSTKSLTGRK